MNILARRSQGRWVNLYVLLADIDPRSLARMPHNRLEGDLCPCNRPGPWIRLGRPALQISRRISAGSRGKK